MLELCFQKSLNGANGKILLEVDTRIQGGEFVSLFGKSGAGKTTMLRIISGLDSPDSGRISLDGEVWFDSKSGVNLPPQKRKIGFVFQDYALFPHLNVYKNLTFGLKNKRETKKVDEILSLMEIEALRDKRIDELSGGQKQRVALARALVYECQILLLDEPLSALDNEMRGILQDEILRLHTHFGLCTVLVSHDIGEIARLSSRILHLSEGKIINDGDINSVFSASKISSKFNFPAKIVAIEPNGIIFAVRILVNNSIAVITMGREALDYKVGDEILVATKAFNPMVFRA